MSKIRIGDTVTIEATQPATWHNGCPAVKTAVVMIDGAIVTLKRGDGGIYKTYAGHIEPDHTIAPVLVGPVWKRIE